MLHRSLCHVVYIFQWQTYMLWTPAINTASSSSLNHLTPTKPGKIERLFGLLEKHPDQGDVHPKEQDPMGRIRLPSRGYSTADKLAFLEDLEDIGQRLCPGGRECRNACSGAKKGGSHCRMQDNEPDQPVLLLNGLRSMLSAWQLSVSNGAFQC